MGALGVGDKDVQVPHGEKFAAGVLGSLAEPLLVPAHLVAAVQGVASEDVGNARLIVIHLPARDLPVFCYRRILLTVFYY